MSRVALAEDSWRGGRQVALKLAGEDETAARQALASEYLLLTSLSHPLVVAAEGFGACRAFRQAWLAMEHVPGPDLRAATAGRGPHAVGALVAQLARALDFVHARGWVHGDVKEENVVVADAGGATPRIRLVDFGLARRVGETPAGRGISGTLSHVAPEALEGAPADPRSDLYAVGVVLYSLLASRPPFVERDPLALVEAHRIAEPPPLSALAPGLPRGVPDLVHALLAKSPEDRPASGAEVAEALGRALGEDVGAEPPEAALAWAVAPRLVHRDEARAEIEALLGRLHAPARGLPEVLWLAGTEGQGKSRLLDELAARARTARACVLRGAPGTDGRGLLASPLADAVRLLGADSDVVQRHAGALARLVPGLGAVPLREDVGADDRSTTQALATWDLLSSLTSQPLAVILDDLHAADADDVELVARLVARIDLEARRGRRVPLALVVAVDDSRGAGGGWTRMLERGRVVRLPALRRSDLQQLLREMLPGFTGAAPLAELVSREGGGSGRMAEAWVAELVRRGLLRRTASGFACDLDAPLARQPPPGVDELARRAVESLPAPARELLVALAEIPGPCDPMAVGRAVGLELAGARSALDLLERHDLVRTSASPAGLVAEPSSEPLRRAARPAPDVASPLAARLLDDPALTATLGSAERATLAERARRPDAARRLLEEALAAAEARRDASLAALLAGRLADLEEAGRRRWALRRRARALIEADRLEMAGTVLACARPGAADEHGAEMAEQLLLEGRLAHRRGYLPAAAECLEASASAARQAGQDPDPEADIERTRVLSALRDPRALPALEALVARRDLPEDRRVAVELVRSAVLLRERRDDEAASVLSAARDAARSRGLELSEAACENNLGILALRRSELDVARRHFARAVAIRERAGARGSLAGTLSNLALAEIRRGRHRPALAHARAAADAHEDVGNLRGALLATINELAAGLNAEDVVAVRRALERAEALLQAVPDAGLRAQLEVMRGELADHLGDADAARAAARDAQAAAVDARDPQAELQARALLARLACEDAAAGDLATELLASEDRSEAAIAALVAMAGRLAEAPAAWFVPADAAGADEGRLALARTAAAAAVSALRSRRSAAPVDVAQAALVLALAASRGGVRPADVRDALGLAEAAAARSPLPPGARVHLLAARAGLARRKGALAEAEAALEQAVAILRRQARALPAGERESFLARPDRAAVREALIGVRRDAVAAEASAGWDALTRDRRPGRVRRGSSDEDAAVRRDLARTRRRSERLAEILEISRGISALLPVDELLSRVLGSAMRFMDADRGFVVLAGPDAPLRFALARDRGGRDVPRAEFAVSHSVLAEVVRTGESVLSSDARADDRFVSKASVLALDLRSVLVAPLVASSSVVGAIYLDNLRESGVFGDEDRELVTLLAAQAAVAVENARLHAAEVEKERIDRELAVARAIQQSLLPRALPGSGAFRLAAVMHPARELGGDWYDVVAGRGGEFTLTVGDVSGKGVGAALLMTMARTLLRAAGAERPLDAWLAEANRVLAAQIDDDKFLTLAALRAGAEGRTVRYALAGHEPPIVYRTALGSASPVPVGGLALGMLPEIAHLLEERSLDLLPGDLVACVSDGVTECRSPSGELFGRERLNRSIAARGEGGADEVVAGLLHDLEAWRASGERTDDVTVVVLEAKRG